MFQTKYNVSIIDSKWQTIKRNLPWRVIPRKGELILIEDDQYYEVVSVIHRLNGSDKLQEIFLVVDPYIGATK
jgi:hypothetical protein